MKRPTGERDIVATGRREKFRVFSRSQLGCTIFQSALPERRHHRVKFDRTLARSPAAYNRPSRPVRGKKPDVSLFLGDIPYLVNARYTLTNRCILTVLNSYVARSQEFKECLRKIKMFLTSNFFVFITRNEIFARKLRF